MIERAIVGVTCFFLGGLALFTLQLLVAARATRKMWQKASYDFLEHLRNRKPDERAVDLDDLFDGGER